MRSWWSRGARTPHTSRVPNDRDNRFYLDWDPISRDEAAVQAWLRDWVHDLDGRGAYLEKLGEERVSSLRPGSAPSGSVDYGDYR